MSHNDVAPRSVEWASPKERCHTNRDTEGGWHRCRYGASHGGPHRCLCGGSKAKNHRDQRLGFT